MRLVACLVVIGLACGDDDAPVSDGGLADAMIDAQNDGSEHFDSGVDARGEDDASLVDASTDAGTDSGAQDASPEDASDLDVSMEDVGVDSGPLPCGLHPVTLGLQPIATGLALPIFVTQAPGSDDTLWIVLKTGLVILWRDGSILPTPFIDLRETIRGGPSFLSERGLIGLAFHPDYESNGRFFVMYTHNARAPLYDVVAEYQRSADDPDVADPTEVAKLLEVDTITVSHNGGHVEFGPDGFLYASLGDGGGSGDPTNLGQNTQDVHGALLRFDPDNAVGGFSAFGNPFSAPSSEVIWAYGLRNPFRFSFDTETGDLYLADVGYMRFEEIDFLPVGTPGGINFGWRGYEASSVYDPTVAATITNHTPPIAEYPHDSTTDPIRGGCSITGGVVYRGAAIPELYGSYLYGDFCSTDVGRLHLCEETIVGHERTDLPPVTNVVGFGRDNAGEVYVVGHGDLGSVYKIVRR